MEVAILTTDGLIHTLEFDAKHGFAAGVPLVSMKSACDRSSDWTAVAELLREDRLHSAARDRAAIRNAVVACERNRIIVTRLPSAVVETAASLQGIFGKTIVVTAALSDQDLVDAKAPHNLWISVGVVQILPPGVYSVIDGKVAQVTGGAPAAAAREIGSC